MTLITNAKLWKLFLPLLNFYHYIPSIRRLFSHVSCHAVSLHSLFYTKEHLTA